MNFQTDVLNPAGKVLPLDHKNLEYFQNGLLLANIRGYLCLLMLVLLIVIHVPVTAESVKRYQLNVPWPTILPPNLTGKTLLVPMPKTAPGFDTLALVYYDQENYQLRYDVDNQWVDTPARMFLPLLVLYLEATGKFKAVLSTTTTSSPVGGELHLETEIMRLRHESLSHRSEVYLVFRAQLLDTVKHQVIATKVFEIRQPAGDTDQKHAETYVWATNQAFALVLKKLKNFIIQLK